MSRIKKLRSKLKKNRKRLREIRSQSQRYAGIAAIVFSIFVYFVSSRLYPDFSWQKNAISEFGYQKRSFFFFNPALVTLCALMFIFIADLLKRMGIKLVSLLGHMFWISIGALTTAALFPDQTYDMIHGVAAYTCFIFFTFGLYAFGIKIHKLGDINASKFSLIVTTVGLAPTLATYFMFSGHAIPEAVFVLMIVIWIIYFTFYDVNQKKLVWSFV